MMTTLSGWLNELRARHGGGLLATSAAAFVVFVLGHGLAFMTQLLVTRALGAHSFGVFAYVTAWLSVLSYFAMFGFHVSLLRFVPVYVSRGDWGLLRGSIRYAELFSGAISLAIIAIGLGVVLLLGARLESELHWAFLAGFPLVLLWSSIWIRCSIVRAFGGVVSALVPMRIVRELFVLVAVALLLLIGHAAGAAPVMALTVAGSLVALWVVSRSVRRLQPPELAQATAKYDSVTWRAAAFPLFIITAVEAIFDRTGVLVLGSAGLSQESGIYFLVFNMAMLVLVPKTAVDTIFAPRIARLHAENNEEAVRALIARASWLSFLSGTAVALALSVVAEPLLGWFGPEFTAGATALKILLLGQVIATGSGSQVLVLAMTGHETAAARALVLTTVANFILTAALVSSFGLNGAAIATALALVFWNVLMAFDIWKRLQLWPGIFCGLQTAPAA